MSSDTAEDKYEGEVGPNRRKLPENRGGITAKVEITSPVDGQTQEGYVIANVHPDGSLGEIFLHGFGKTGSTLDGWVQLSGLLFSIALQYGAEFPMLARKIAHMKFPPYGHTNDPGVPYCNSVPDYVVRKLARWFGNRELNEQLDKIAKEVGIS